MRVEGYLYQQNSVKREKAAIVVDGSYFTLYLYDGGSEERNGQRNQRRHKEKIYKALVDGLDIPPRVGNTSRKIQIDENTLFETMDNDSVDELFVKGKNNSNWIHSLESKWRVAIPSIFVGIAFVGALFVWGIPFAAEQIAYGIPESINEKISEGSFEAIDRLMLSPSELPEAKQNQISGRFNELVANYSQSNFNYQLHFRDMSGQPNAFALPDGNIVITDKLIEQSDGEINEVLAVLLHEIGHVEKRHGLRLALEASSTALIIAMLTGDLSASDDLLVTLPTVLSTSAFSRQHEEEADTFAFEFMQKAKIDPIHFARIMSKITHTDYDEGKVKDGKSQNNEDEKEPDQDEEAMNRVEKVFQYMASHPVTEERIRRAEAASKQFTK